MWIMEVDRSEHLYAHQHLRKCIFTSNAPGIQIPLKQPEDTLHIQEADFLRQKTDSDSNCT